MQAVEKNYRSIDNTTFRRWMLTIAGAFVCFLASLYVMFNVPAVGFELLFVLPATNAVLILLFKRVFFNPLQRIGVFAMNVITFIRLVVIPVLMSFTGTINTEGYNLPSVTARGQAIWLMVYEAFLIYTVLYLFTKKYDMDNKKIKVPDDPQVIADQGGESILIWMALIYLVALFIVYPGSFSGITIFSKTISLTKANQEYKGHLLVTAAKYVITSALLYNCYRRYIMTKNNLYILLSFVIIVMSIGIVSVNVRNYFLLTIIIGIYYMRMLYRKYVNIFVFAILLLVIVSFIGTVFITLTLRTREFEGNLITSVLGENLKETQLTLQSYFSGVSGVAHSIDMRNYFSELSRAESVKYELSSTLFPWSFIYQHFVSVDVRYRVDYLFNYMSFGNFKGLSLITPMVGQGLFYFGPVLAPVFSVICAAILGFIEKLRFRSESGRDYYLLALFSLYIGVTGMYSFSIQLRTLSSIFMPAAAIVIFARLIKLLWNNYREGLMAYRG